MYADKLLLPWVERIRQDVSDVSIYDCHTHVGHNDPSGFSASLGTLVEALEFVDGRAAVFPLKEPAGYAEANLRLVEAAGETGGRLVAFARLDPGDAPLLRAQEALDAGSRGLKLHPAGEEFELSDPRLSGVWELADAERLPIVVHAGPEIGSVGRSLLSLASQYPGARLIVAHAAVLDLAWIWRELAGLPNLFFDTSWWTPSDVLALLAFVPASQVLNGSDLPYCTPVSGALSTLRCSLELGLSRREIELVLGGQFERLVAREEPVHLERSKPRSTSGPDPLFERPYVYLLAAQEAMQRGEDPEQMLVLARHSTHVADDHPHADVMRSAEELLDLYERRDMPETDNQYAPGWDLIAAAALLVRTPKAPVPAAVATQVSR